ncbi:MAG: hypothetical protein ACOCVJ_01150 [Verrucomicrobiota bacterium]
MAWRIADYVEHGEIDNRTRGRVTGQLWLRGLEGPVRLELEGNAWRDLAGQRLRFRNPDPKPMPEDRRGFAREQVGTVGDMTAARKVKVLDFPIEELDQYYKTGKPMPYHWGNCLYLEWHSERNGRVVIEATEFELTPDPEAAWRMSESEEQDQHQANADAMTGSLDRLVEAAARTEDPDEEEDSPQSLAEAEADAEAARMELLIDRVTARLEREKDADAERYEEIMAEERQRLRRERGEPEPEPLSEEELLEREKWIDAMNAAAGEALEADESPITDEPHPLVEQCRELSNRLGDDIESNGWLDEHASSEHPLNEVIDGIAFAAAKLAGALDIHEEWPPDPLFAGNSLVRLKKARKYLRNADAGLNAAREDQLADLAWLDAAHRELDGIRQALRSLIEEVREVLRDDL